VTLVAVHWHTTNPKPDSIGPPLCPGSESDALVEHE
jgi:hypothetical protein